MPDVTKAPVAWLAGRTRALKLNLDSYGGGFTARTLTFLMFWLISA